MNQSENIVINTEMHMCKPQPLQKPNRCSPFLLCFLLLLCPIGSAEEAIKLQSINSFIQNNQLSQATQILATIDRNTIQANYGHYNLGIAFIAQNKIKTGIALLDDVTHQITHNDEQRALKDKAHLITGQTLLKHKKPFLAKKHFIKISSYSLFYSEALLGAGQANFALRQYQQALESWTTLQKQPISGAVLESFYLIPNLLFRLGFYDSSLNEYQYAIEQYKKIIHTLESAITDLNNPNAILPQHIQATTLFKSYINHHLIPLLASHSFQQEIRKLNEKSQIARKAHIKTLNQSAISILQKQKNQLNNYLAAVYLATAQIYDKKTERALGTVQ